MREFLAERFEQYGSGGFTGSEIAQIIRQAQMPQATVTVVPDGT